MHPRTRDGLLAAVALVAVTAATTAAAGVGPLLSPAAAAVGVGGALLIEAAFLRYADRLLPLWERRGVPAAACVLTVAAAAFAARRDPRVAGAVAWGLAAYLLVLGAVLAGVGNPLSPLGAGRDPDPERDQE